VIGKTQTLPLINTDNTDLRISKNQCHLRESVVKFRPITAITRSRAITAISRSPLFDTAITLTLQFNRTSIEKRDGKAFLPVFYSFIHRNVDRMWWIQPFHIHLHFSSPSSSSDYWQPVRGELDHFECSPIWRRSEWQRQSSGNDQRCIHANSAERSFAAGRLRQ
jgi:hypothetical protein